MIRSYEIYFNTNYNSNKPWIRSVIRRIWQVCRYHQSSFDDLEYKIIDSIYVDPLTSTIYTVDLMIVDGKAHEIDSIIVIYDTKVSVFINNVEHIVPNPGESMFVWINLIQFANPYPPFDLHDRVYRNSPKVSFYFE